MKQQPVTPSLLPDFGPKGAPLHLTNPTPTTTKLTTTGFPCTFQTYKTITLGALRFKNELKIAEKKTIFHYSEHSPDPNKQASEKKNKWFYPH